MGKGCAKGLRLGIFYRPQGKAVSLWTPQLIIIKLSEWGVQNFETVHKFAIFRPQTCCGRQGTCEQENPCTPPLCQFNTIPLTRQKSICTAVSQHLPFWGTETKAIHFKEEKVTQIHIREGEFGMTKKVPACPISTHMLEKSPTGITVWIQHTLVLLSSVGSTDSSQTG